MLCLWRNFFIRRNLKTEKKCQLFDHSSHFDEKLVNFNFKMIKFFRQHFFGIPLCYIEWQQKRSHLLREISLQIKKVERKVWILRNYWVKEIGFLFLVTTLYVVIKKKFHRKNSPPNKPGFTGLCDGTLISIMFFRNTLNHAFEFKRNCFHNKNGHWRKKMNKN